MAKAYSWTTAETMNTDSMAAALNLLLDSCRVRESVSKRVFGSEVKHQAGSDTKKLFILGYATFGALVVILNIDNLLTQRKSLYP